jgi:hypothetical protein
MIVSIRNQEACPIASRTCHMAAPSTMKYPPSWSYEDLGDREDKIEGNLPLR